MWLEILKNLGTKQAERHHMLQAWTPQTKTRRVDKSCQPCLVQKNLQNFLDFPSHQIFRRTQGVFNVNKNKN